MRILVADDNAPERFVIEDMLGEWGYDVKSACDGEEAWAAINDPNPPEVAVLDWEMPGMDGIEVCRLAKGRTGVPYLFIVMVTARTARSDFITGLQSGADDFLTKPVDPEELRCRLEVAARILRYETELRDKNRQLLVFNQAFHDSIQDMYITDPRGTITHVNPSFLRRYGYKEEEVLGCNMDILVPEGAQLEDLGITQTQHDETLADISRNIFDNERGNWVGTLPNRTKSGDILWTQTHIGAIRDADNSIVGYVTIPDDITRRVERETAIRLECYRAISDLAEARDNETGLHLKRMSDFCRVLAKALKMPRKFVDDIATFSPLHDIGKVGISDAILLAPRKLTDEEFEIMKTHPSIGYEILRNRETLEMAAEIAWTHHEKFNGKGYPRGLKADEIPMSGRIVAVCDVYDALRSARPYKAPWPHEKAAGVIFSEAGQHFDPKVVDAFREIEKEMCETFDSNVDGLPEA